MHLPILAYGHDLLTRPCTDLDDQYPGLEELIFDMWQTMKAAEGCGLAASQVNHPVNLFIVDSLSGYNKMDPDSRAVYFDDNNGIKDTFINAKITASSERRWISPEGCLSLPGLQADVERPWTITISYLDAEFQPQQRTYSGLTARMIQHEYDHTRGVLYLEYLSAFRRKRMSSSLKRISKGKVQADYVMSFPPAVK